MNLYLVISSAARTWVRTQVEASKLAKEQGGTFELIDVPTPKKETMIEFLNELEATLDQIAEDGETPHPELVTADEDEAFSDDPPEPAYEHMNATNILRRMDAMLAANKGAGAIADYVSLAPPEEVALIAAAVAMRLKGAGDLALPPGQVLGK